MVWLFLAESNGRLHMNYESENMVKNVAFAALRIRSLLVNLIIKTRRTKLLTFSFGHYLEASGGHLLIMTYYFSIQKPDYPLGKGGVIIRMGDHNDRSSLMIETA